MKTLFSHIQILTILFNFPLKFSDVLVTSIDILGSASPDVSKALAS